MTFIVTIVVVALQLIVGYLLGFVGAMVSGAGNGWELLVIPTGNTIGIWGIGALAAKLRGMSPAYLVSLVVTAVGSGLGIVLILLTPATGFAQLLYPLLGALAGYYISGLIKK